MAVAHLRRSLQLPGVPGGKLGAQAKRSGCAGVELAEEDAVQKLIITLVILGFVAFVYQGLALSDREAAESPGPAATQIIPRP
jgi:hypothetical protein